MKNKKLVLFLVLIVIFGLTGCNKNISKELVVGTEVSVIEYFNEVGDEFGVQFTKVTADGVRFIAYSNNFGDLPDETKLVFFARLDERIPLLKGLDTDGGSHLSEGEDLWIETPGRHTYTASISGSVEGARNELWDLGKGNTTGDVCVFATERNPYHIRTAEEEQRLQEMINNLENGNSNTNSSASSSAKTCQSCNRSFEDATNKNYISHTGMCKNCYQNFCWATGKTPENYDW